MKEQETRESPKAQESPKAHGKLADAAGPILSLIIVLKRARDLDSFTDLRTKVEKMILEFRSRLRDKEVSALDIDDSTYALAATIDETLLNARWSGRDGWEKNALAKTYCNDEFVGLGFYDKLAQLRRSSTPRRDVVEVFYFCLISGFQGKMVEDPRQLADLVDELSKEIAAPGKTVSVNATSEKEKGLEPIGRFPWPIVIIASVFLPLLVWLIGSNIIDRHADRILKALGR
jgi:type VI secretion system protein ImpK